MSTNLPRLQVNRANTAHVFFGDLRLFFSYETCVGFHTPETGWVVSENIWSPTTGRHMTSETPVHPNQRTPHQEFLNRLAAVCGEHLVVPS